MTKKILDALELASSKWYSVFFTALGFMYFVYEKAFKNFNGIVFAPGGDGIKNYYTYMFQAKYGETFWEFKGMNYPFYEHIVYTDAHPLLAYIIGKLSLADYGVGILNFLMLISYPVSAVIIHSLFKHYKVSSVWSYTAALIVCFLSPQIFRLTGHLSLSYVFAIPLMWYLLIKIQNSINVIWSILMFIILLVFFFTHPYLGLILAVFGLFYSLVFWFFERQNWKKMIWRIVLPITAAIGLFRISILLTDTHIDRMKTPTGFFDMYASWRSLLMPHHGPLNVLREQFNGVKAEWETMSYLGLFTTVILLFILGYALKNRKAIQFNKVINTPVGKIYLVGHFVLLFSFCFPLKYNFLRWVVEALGPLQQFRVLGRFIWVYFYIASIISIVVLYRIMNKSGKKRYFKILFFVGCIFSVFEFLPSHVGVSEAITKQKNPFQVSNLSEEVKGLVEWTNKQDYDAILFLPFTHLSSENIFLLGSEKANYHSFLLSYHTGLPLLNTVSSRTSVSESVAFQNLFSPEFVEKSFQHLLPKDAKIMLVKNKGVLNKNEMRMIHSSASIYENNEFKVYDFSFEKWNSQHYFNKVKDKYAKANMPLNEGWKSDTLSAEFVYDSFDSIPEINTFAGTGAFAGQKNGFHIIKDRLKLSEGNYICSFWYNFRVDRADQLAVVEQIFKNGEGKWVAENDIRQSNHIVEDWLMVKIPFTVTDSVVETKIILSGNKGKKWFIVDELLIQKENETPLFKREIRKEPYIVYNNYRLKEDSFSE